MYFYGHCKYIPVCEDLPVLSILLLGTFLLIQAVPQFHSLVPASSLCSFLYSLPPPAHFFNKCNFNLSYLSTWSETDEEIYCMINQGQWNNSLS